MKNLAYCIILLIVLACSVVKKTTSTQLFEILTEQKDGGANIQFYEIISESNEIKMLLNDKHLKNKIKENDIKTCNFIIVNAGKKTAGNNNIKIERITETSNKIVISIKDNSNINKPAIDNLETVNPYLILKINSKKDIEFQ